MRQVANGASAPGTCGTFAQTLHSKFVGNPAGPFPVSTGIGSYRSRPNFHQTDSTVISIEWRMEPVAAAVRQALYTTTLMLIHRTQ
jgi:hypothetical protein